MDDFDIAQTKIRDSGKRLKKVSRTRRTNRPKDAHQGTDRPDVHKPDLVSGGDEHLSSPTPNHGAIPWRETLNYTVAKFAANVEALADATGSLLEVVFGTWLGPIACPAGKIAVQLTIYLGIPLAIGTLICTGLVQINIPHAVGQPTAIAMIIGIWAKAIVGRRGK